MPIEVRGLFVLEPPSGGLARLRQSLRHAGPGGRWLPLLPWAASAGLLLAILLVVQRGGAAFTAQIVEGVQGREDAGTWTRLSSPEQDVRVYLARPAVEESPARGGGSD
jgi:hypothetical protein